MRGKMDVSAEILPKPAQSTVRSKCVASTCVAEDGKATSKMRHPFRIFCRLGTTNERLYLVSGSSVGEGKKPEFADKNRWIGVRIRRSARPLQAGIGIEESNALGHAFSSLEATNAQP